MLKFKKKFITDATGNKVAVIIPFKQFQKIAEDLSDSSMVKQRAKEKTISLSALKQKLL